MKTTLLLYSVLLFSKATFSQTPTYYYYDPANSGVNNLYFNTGVSYKFLFIYTQAELASVGVTGPVTITSIWLKSNTAYSLTINDLIFTLGHSTLSTPDPDFADNFDVGTPVIVLDEAIYNYTTIAGPWNDPPAGWSEIPVTAPFVYNGTDNLVIQGEYSGINYPIPIYANNGGVPITQLSSVYGASTADDYTARPMFGFSGPLAPVSFAASDSTVCEKLCIDFFDFSSNNPVSWSWSFPGGSPSSSTDQNPVQICYNNPGTYDVTLISTNATGSDTLTLADFITVYATPATPTITAAGSTLTSSLANAYQWQFNFVDIPGATNQSYTATQSGAYTVIVTDVNGCTSSETIDFTFTNAEDVFDDALIFIAPNPSDGMLSIEFINNQDVTTIKIELLNSLGQEIFSVNDQLHGSNYSRTFDLSNVASGAYILNVSLADGSSMRKKILLK